MQRMWHHLTGIPFFLAVLVWMMILTTLGTLAQAHMPLAQAMHVYFMAPVVWLGGWIPTPGMPLILAYLSLSLLVQLVQKPLKLSNMGSWLAHAGVLMLIISGLASLTADYGYVVATEGTPTRLWQAEGATETAPPHTWPAKGLLPFEVTVLQFRARFHAGTATPASFESDVLITPLPTSPTEQATTPPFTATIRMNEPLRTQGYTLYQASYILPDTPTDKPISILAVVHDRTRLLPYLATTILCVGLLLQAFLRWRALMIVLLPLSLLSPLGHSWEADALASIPVQHQGRVKPLATVASTAVPFVLGQSLSLDESLGTLAIWLARPSVLLNETLLAIPPRTATETLGLPTSTPTLLQLVGALAPLHTTIRQLENLPAGSLNSHQQHLLRVAERAETALALARTFVMWQPLATPSPAMQQTLNISTSEPLTAAMLMHHRTQLLDIIKPIQPNQTLTPLQAEALHLAAVLRSVRPDIPNTLLRVIPPANSHDDWLSPWQAAQPTISPTQLQTETLQAWQQALATNSTHPLTYGPTLPISLWKIHLEVTMLRYPPISYAVAPLLLAMVGFGLQRWRLVSLGLAWGGLGLISLGLVIRMLILQRPPVATLYESMLFVAWATLFMGLMFRHKHPANLPLGVVGAAGLLMLSHGLHQGTDTMGMLTAVLNTNFWLATHVLTITGGYAASLLVGGLGLWALGQRTLKTTSTARASTHTWLKHITLWAMALTATGTLLGGVWAGQSWGRFWGWDPKENGALILTLWLIALAHIRMMKPIPILPWLIAAAATPLVVAMAWFGVNLLGVGLHSYGFATGLANGLAMFCGGYTSIIIGLLLFNRYGNKP